MERFLKAIENCLNNDIWYGALIISLLMPDICGSLESPSLSSKTRYKNWFEKYLSGEYNKEIMGEKVVFMNADDFYGIRCSILHQGFDTPHQLEQGTIEKFYFSVTGSHRVWIEGKLVIDVKRLCCEIISAVHKWVADNKDNTQVQDNINKLLSIYTGPFEPHKGVQIS